jgi:hypothetical protein
MAPRAKRARAVDGGDGVRAGAPSPAAAEPGPDSPAGPVDEVSQPCARRGRPRLSRVESAGSIASGDGAGDAAHVNGERARLITDLRQNSIENLRVEHRRLKEATRNAQRDMRNAKRRRNRILAKIRNLDAESVLSVLIDRGLSDPHAPASSAASSTQAVAAPPPAASIEEPGAPGGEDEREDSDRESTEHAPSVGQRDSEDEREIAALMSAQPSGSQAATAIEAAPREQKPEAEAHPPQAVVQDEE